MKKFMTVLLVVAVLFSFSFGSAFAAINYNADNTTALITAAQTELAKAKENLDDVKDYYLRNYKAGNIAGAATFTKAAVEVIIEDAFDAFEAEIVKVYEAQIVAINGKALASADLEAGKKEVANAIATEYAKYDTAAEVTALIEADQELMADLMEAQFDIAKAEALATLDKVNFANYSTELPDEVTFEGKYLSNQQIAQEVIKDAKEEFAKLVFDEISGPENYINYFFNVLVGRAVVETDGVYYVRAEFKDGAALIPTVSNEAKVEKTLAEEKAYQISVLEGKLALKEAEIRKDLAAKLEVATEKKDADAVKAINKALEGLDAKFDATKEGWTYQLNAKKTTEAVIELAGKINNAIGTIVLDAKYEDATLNAFEDRAEAVDAVTALAAKLTAQTGFDGSALYNADAIADALEADIDAIWFGGKAEAVAKIQANADLVKAEMNRVLYGTNVTLNKVVYPVVAAWDAYITENIEADSDYEEEAQAIVAETKAAIRAAETVADVDAAFVAGYEKLTAVTKESVKTNFQKTDAAKAAAQKYTTLLGVAYDTKVAEYGKDFAKDYDVTKKTLIAALVAEFADAYNATEMEAAYKAGLAEIEGLKTEAALEAEQKAINDAILAIKAPVTAADEATILALAEDAEDLADYVKMIGATGNYDVYSALLGQYVDAIEKLAIEEIEKAIKAIGTVTVEDAAAIEAVEAMIEAADEKGYDVSKLDLTEMNAKLLAAKIDAVEDAIAAINPAANPLNIAAIKAAREAYAALGEYTIDEVMYAKLLSLENLMAADIVASVESLKITAKSTVKKGSITVKWTVKGETAGVEAYEIWKSTKKNSGFKKAFTTEKMSYKNTKGLKKGTRYFYKVRAIAFVEGEKVTSDWSNKAYRVAK